MAKTGKDREGNYHPPKGRPSGEGYVKGIAEMKPGASGYTDIDIDDPDDLPGDVRVRHPNRNTDKKEIRSNKKDASIFRKEHAAAAAPAITPNGNTVVPAEIDTMDQEAFKQLAGHRFTTSVTIYIPTHAAGVAVNEKADVIVFKNTLQHVAVQLKAKGTRDMDSQRILAPAYTLVQDDVFWNNQRAGLGVFLADGFCQYVRMPVSPPTVVLCNRSFYLSPLIPWVISREKFYVLVLSKKRAQVFRGDAFGMQPVLIPELPEGIDDVVHFEEKDDQNLFRTGSSGAGEGANYHGIGAGKPDEKKNIQLYLDEVDRTLWTQLLSRQNCPLVLAGVGYELPIYKQSSQYKFIWPESLTGNYEHTDLSSLYHAARELLEPYFLEKQNQALEQFQNKSATALTSSLPGDIIPAAHYGRIDTLFVSKGAVQIWGTFDEQSNVLSIHDEPAAEDEPLTDKTVVQTLLHGGNVFEIDARLLPSGAAMAALMRY